MWISPEVFKRPGHGLNRQKWFYYCMALIGGTKIVDLFILSVSWFQTTQPWSEQTKVVIFTVCPILEGPK